MNMKISQITVAMYVATSASSYLFIIMFTLWLKEHQKLLIFPKFNFSYVIDTKVFMHYVYLLCKYIQKFMCRNASYVKHAACSYMCVVMLWRRGLYILLN